MKTTRGIFTGSAAFQAAFLTALFFFTSFASAGPKTVLEPRVSEALSASRTTGDYYTVRPDLRRCVSPMCGGYWVKRINHARTRCANGRTAAECYVAEIDWREQPQGEAAGTILRGHIVAKVFGRFGNLGEFKVTESWRPATEREPAGTFYQLKDSGIRCITYPCLTIENTRLNSPAQTMIAGVNLEGAGAKEELVAEAMRAMSEGRSLIVAGAPARLSGPAGRAFELKATQFYLRSRKQSSESKPCFKSGCSNHVCVDENVITTCEWRPEYACYQKARCERQADGKCGFTKTPELIDCLKKAKETSP